MGSKASKIRRWSRNIHRDLSFFFSGVLIIYAVSGFVMNHKGSINPNYDIDVRKYTVECAVPSQAEMQKADVLRILEEIDEEDNYTKHYFPETGKMKVFLKGGSNFTMDVNSKQAVYERVSKRPIIGSMARLHYNPGKWWTIFSDIFAISLLIIVITGFSMMKGKKGLIGVGGIELLIGIAIPLAFLFFW